MSEGPTPQGTGPAAAARPPDRRGRPMPHRRLAAIDIPDDEALIGPVDDVRTTLADKRDEAVDGLDRASTVLGSLQALLDGQHLPRLRRQQRRDAGRVRHVPVGHHPRHRGRARSTIGDVRPDQPPGARRGRRDAAGARAELPVARHREGLPQPRPLAAVRAVGRDRLPHVAEGAARAARSTACWRSTPRRSGTDHEGGRPGHRQRHHLHAADRAPPAAERAVQAVPEGPGPGERTDQLGEVARAVFDELESSDWKIGKLATALIDSVGGRHLLLWSARRGRSRPAGRRRRPTARLQEDSLAVSVLSRGRQQARLLPRRRRRRSPPRRRPTRHRGAVDIALRNRTPAKGEPKYVVGPEHRGLAEGEYAGIVAGERAAGGAGSVRFEGGAYSTLVGRDGPTQVQGRYVRILRVTRRRLTLVFTLPGIGRPPDHRTVGPGQTTTWTFDGHEFVVEKPSHGRVR